MRALQPVIGINFGAQKNDRVISSFKIFAVASSLIMFPFWLINMIAPQFALNLMMPSNVFDASSIMNFRIFMILLPVLPIIFMSMTFFPAINNGKPASIMGISRQLLFYVPVMLIFPRLYGIKWVYIGSFLIDSIIILWVFIIVKREFNILRGNRTQLKPNIENAS
jgi:Na+-driven multidrug efflux pump